MKEYRPLVAALVVMALLTPVGIYLPEILEAGGAWGEWGVAEVRKMVGYAPEGMEKGSGSWKAPVPDYAQDAGEGSSLPRRGFRYLLSAFLGVSACGGAAYLLARRLARHGDRPSGDR